MDIIPTPAITMMDRASISGDTITSPAISKPRSPASSRAFLYSAAKGSPVAVGLFRYLEQQDQLLSPMSAFSCRLTGGRNSLPVRRSILAHCSEIVFGVLEVIFRRDPISGQSFGAGECQISFIASLGVLNVTCLVADECGRLISVGGLRSSQHSVGHDFRTLAPPPGEYSRSFALGASRKIS
jgi:hypothetical protein